MRRIQKRTVVLTLIAGLATAGAGFVTLKGRTAENPAKERVQRGEYLVKIMGCNDCHTPWKMGPQGLEPDMTRFLSGHPEEIGAIKHVKPADPFLWSAGRFEGTAIQVRRGRSHQDAPKLRTRSLDSYQSLAVLSVHNAPDRFYR